MLVIVNGYIYNVLVIVVVTGEREECYNGNKNLCRKVPLELYIKVRAEIEQR